MSAASNYTEKNILNALLRGVAFPLPARTYISLHTGDPSETGSVEVTAAQWPAYARRDAEQGGAIGTGWADPQPAADGSHYTGNAKQITFPGYDADAQLTVTHWGVYDAPVGGNYLVGAELFTPRTIKKGDVFVFDIGALTVKQL